MGARDLATHPSPAVGARRHQIHVDSAALESTARLARERWGTEQGERAFELVINMLSEHLFHVAHRVLGNEKQAQDAISEALAKMWHRLRYYDDSRGPFLIWARATAYATARSKLRPSHEGARRVESQWRSVKAPDLDLLPPAASDDVLEEGGFSRSTRQPLSKQESDHLARIARVEQIARDVLGNSEKAQAWLRRPNRALRNQVPLDLLDTDDGARLVEQILGRLTHGLFS